MPHNGLEKRRRGPLNRLRRMLYGVLVSAASASALATSGHDASSNASGPRLPLPLAHTNAPLRLDGDVLLLHDQSDLPGGDLLAYGGLSPLLLQASAISADFAFVSIGGQLLTAHYLGDDLDRIGKGLVVDFLLPELGYFHLNLYSGHDGPERGKRWLINPDGFALPQSADRFWSLGGSLALERNDPYSRRQLQFVPQLVLNLDQVVPMQGRMQALISYHNWLAAADTDPVRTGRIPQISLHWSF